jgi:hypothetical protein
MDRDAAIVNAVFSHRLLHTNHVVALFSGGEAVATLPRDTEGLLLGGPKIIADERFFKLRFGDIEGWVTEDYLALPANVLSVGEAIRTKMKTYVRSRAGGSPQTISKRTRVHIDRKWLMGVEEPELRMRDRRRRRIPGSDPRILGLADGGADFLATWYGLERGGVRWREKNRELGDKGRGAKEHVLAQADALIPIIAACNARYDVDYIAPPDVLRGASEAARKSKSPYLWKVLGQHDGKRKRMSATPDKLFALRLAWREPGKDHRYFLLEADRATEPNERNEVTKNSSIMRKLITYGTGYQQRYHKERFNIPVFRCLIVTTSEKRVENMMALVPRLGKEMRIPVNLFYFSHFGAYKQDADDIFKHHWRTWERARIIEKTLLD